MFDTLVVFLKEIFNKVNFERKSANGKKQTKLPSRQRAKWRTNHRSVNSYKESLEMFDSCLSCLI